MKSRIPLCMAAALLLGLSGVARASVESPKGYGTNVARAASVNLTLAFSARVDLRASRVEVRDDRGHRIEIGALRVGETNTDVDIPLVAGALKPGLYTISWRAVSEGGIVDAGAYNFTIDPMGPTNASFAQQ